MSLSTPLDATHVLLYYPTMNSTTPVSNSSRPTSIPNRCWPLNIQQTNKRIQRVTWLYLLYAGVCLSAWRWNDLGIELTLNTVEVDNELCGSVHLASNNSTTQHQNYTARVYVSTTQWHVYTDRQTFNWHQYCCCWRRWVALLYCSVLSCKAATSRHVC